MLVRENGSDSANDSGKRQATQASFLASLTVPAKRSPKVIGLHLPLSAGNGLPTAHVCPLIEIVPMKLAESTYEASNAQIRQHSKVIVANSSKPPQGSR